MLVYFWLIIIWQSISWFFSYRPPSLRYSIDDMSLCCQHAQPLYTIAHPLSPSFSLSSVEKYTFRIHWSLRWPPQSLCLKLSSSFLRKGSLEQYCLRMLLCGLYTSTFLVSPTPNLDSSLAVCSPRYPADLQWVQWHSRQLSPCKPRRQVTLQSCPHPSSGGEPLPSPPSVRGALWGAAMNASY